MAQSLTKSDVQQKVLKSDKPVLVDFYAAWCGPCQMMSPIIDEIEEELKDEAVVYKVDVDKESDLGNDFQVMSIPTILIFKDGKIVKQFVGFTEKKALLDALKSN